MFTNKTENLDLPQWVGSDKANWDIDLNYAFKQISDYVNTLNEKFSGLDNSDSQFDESIKEINRNIETINTAIDSINETDGIQTADITDLKEKVTKLQSDVSSLTTDFSESSTDLTQRIQTIENDLPSIEQSITTLTQNYNALAEKVETLENSGGKVLYYSETTFDSSSGTSSDTLTLGGPAPGLESADLDNTLIEVSLSKNGIKQASNNGGKVFTTGLIPISKLVEDDLLFSISGMTISSFTDGYLDVKFKRTIHYTFELSAKFNLQSAIHSWNGVPSIVIKIIKLR